MSKHNKPDKNNNGVIKFTRKEFIPRNSPYTDLLENKYAVAVYNIILAIFIIAVGSNVVQAIDEPKSIKFAGHYIVVGFGKFPLACVIWLAMFICTLTVYKIFCFWANARKKFISEPDILRLWDYIWLVAFLLYCVLSTCVTGYLTRFLDIAIASSFFVNAEQVRMLMKCHVFVRTNVPRILDSYNSKQVLPLPNFEKFLYYFFAPTLLYRDSYPRTEKIHWSYVTANFLKVIVVIYAFSLVFANHLVPEFQNFGLNPPSWSEIITSMVRMIVPSSVLLFGSSYFFLHAWHNAWAEMLRFADRMFYEDWWTADLYTTYFRTWNVIVHDYLHNFVYKDSYQLILPGSKFFATVAVFVLSIFFHEYIVFCSVGYNCPLIFIYYTTSCIAFTMYTHKLKRSNLFILLSLMFGSNLYPCLYVMEYYARINCPRKSEVLQDYFIPRALTCYDVL